MSVSYWRSKMNPCNVYRVEARGPAPPEGDPRIYECSLEEGPSTEKNRSIVGEVDLEREFYPAEDDYLPPNPKKALGAGKPDLSLVPPVSIAHTAMAFEDGGYKYGPYNWRERAVEARTYIAAAKRHLNDYLDGTDYADDSEVHNLGHVMACCAILLDAHEHGNLIDNRPPAGASAAVHDRMKNLKAKFREEGRKQWGPDSKM